MLILAKLGLISINLYNAIKASLYTLLAFLVVKIALTYSMLVNDLMPAASYEYYIVTVLSFLLLVVSHGLFVQTTEKKIQGMLNGLIIATMQVTLIVLTRFTLAYFFAPDLII